jgi:copper chaperone
MYSEPVFHHREERAAMASSTYTVQGMTCDHCAGSVTAEVAKISGVAEVTVDVAAGRITVTSAEPLQDDAVAEAVEEAGYVVVSG